MTNIDADATANRHTLRCEENINLLDPFRSLAVCSNLNDDCRCQVWERKPSAAHKHRAPHRRFGPQQHIAHDVSDFLGEFIVVVDPNDPATFDRQFDKMVLDRCGHERNRPVAMSFRRSDKNEVRQTIDRMGDEAACGEFQVETKRALLLLRP